jgi:hypothetical protein
MRWLLPASLVMALAGYFGPWVNHPVAGLVITGLDFGEYVKFLPEVRAGTVVIWRPGFYVPLVAISIAALLAAYRADLGYRWWLRIPLLVLSIIAALNLVPPAWTPARLLEPEFRLQTISLILLLLGVAFSPFLALLSRPLAAAIVTLLALVGIVAPLYGFYQVLPAIQILYNHPLPAGWGLWLMEVGLLLLIISMWRLPHITHHAIHT